MGHIKTIIHLQYALSSTYISEIKFEHVYLVTYSCAVISQSPKKNYKAPRSNDYYG